MGCVTVETVWDQWQSSSVMMAREETLLESVSPVDSGMKQLLNVYRKEMVRIATLHKCRCV